MHAAEAADGTEEYIALDDHAADEGVEADAARRQPVKL